MSPRRERVSFTADDDVLLCKYLAIYNPTKDGRMGNAVYQMLEANTDRKWSWSSRHSWSSWRERYKKHEDEFDYKIREYQKRKKISVEQLAPSKRTPVSRTKKAAGKGKGKKRALESDDDFMDTEEDRVLTKRKRAEDASERDLGRKKPRTRRIEPPALKEQREGSNEPELPPHPPTSDYGGQIFTDDSNTEEDEDTIEVALVEGAGNDATPLAEKEEHSPSRHDTVCLDLESLDDGSTLPATLSHLTPTPHERKGSKPPPTPRTSSTHVQRNQMTRTEQHSFVGSHNDQITKRLLGTQSSFTRRLTRSRRNDDNFFASSESTKATPRRNSTNAESSDDDVSTQRRRRHQPPKMIESIFGRTSIARENRISDKVENIGQESSPARLRDVSHSGSLSASTSPRKVPSALPDLGHDITVCSDHDDRIRRLKRELAAASDKAQAERTQRTKTREGEVHHAFSQETQPTQTYDRRTRSLDNPIALSRSADVDAAARESGLDHPQSSPITPQRRSAAVSSRHGEWVAGSPRRLATSHIDEDPSNRQSPILSPSRRHVPGSSSVELSPNRTRRLASSHQVDQFGDPHQIIASATTAPHSPDLHAFERHSPQTWRNARIKDDGNVSIAMQAAERTSKVSANSVSSLVMSRQELRELLLKKHRLTDEAPMNVESSKKGSHSPVDNKDLVTAETSTHVTSPPASPINELANAFFNRKQNRPVVNTKVRVEPKLEPEDPGLPTRLRASEPPKSTPRARFAESPESSITEQQNAIPRRSPFGSGPQAQLEVTGTSGYSSPRLAPSAIISSRANSPLGAPATSRRSTAPSGSIKGLTAAEDHQRTVGGYPSTNVPTGRTPRIDLSARPRRTLQAPIRASSTSTAAPSVSTARRSTSARARGSNSSSIAPSRRTTLLPDANASILPSPSHSVNFPISDTDRAYIMQHGIETIIEKLAMNHGFQQSVTWNIYKLTKDLPMTDQVLRKMRESANNTGVDVIRRISEGVRIEDDHDEDEGDDEGDGDEGENGIEKSLNLDVFFQRRRKPRTSLRRRSSRRLPLNWKPADEKTEYSPQKLTRASEWVRLEMQGRTREAVSRESRRASISATGKSHRHRLSSEVP